MCPRWTSNIIRRRSSICSQALLSSKTKRTWSRSSGRSTHSARSLQKSFKCREERLEEGQNRPPLAPPTKSLLQPTSSLVAWETIKQKRPKLNCSSRQAASAIANLCNTICISSSRKHRKLIWKYQATLNKFQKQTKIALGSHREFHSNLASKSLQKLVVVVERPRLIMDEAARLECT